MQVTIIPDSKISYKSSKYLYEEEIIVPMAIGERRLAVSCDIKVASNGSSHKSVWMKRPSFDSGDDVCSALVVRPLAPRRHSSLRRPQQKLRRCSPLVPSLNPAVVDGPSEDESETDSDEGDESSTSCSDSEEYGSTPSSPALSLVHPTASQLSTYANPNSSRVSINMSAADLPSFILEAIANPKPLKSGPRGDLRCYACNSPAKRDVIRCDYSGNYGRYYRCCDNHNYRLFLAYDDVVGNLPDNPCCRCGESMKLQVSKMRVRRGREEKRTMYFRCRRGGCTLKKDVLDEEGRCFAVDVKYLPMLRHLGIC